MQPIKDSYPVYFDYYFTLIKLNDVHETLAENLHDVKNFIGSIPSSKADFAYSEGKWTIKQVLQHIIDCERILTYRALHIARRDTNALLSFDENAYATNADVSHLSLTEIENDFKAARNNTISLFKSFNTSDLNFIGKTGMGNNNPLAIGYFLPGHAVHHINVIKERYLII